MPIKEQIAYQNPRLIIQTGPAIYDTDVISPFVKTFYAMVNDIRDEVDDATHEYDEQIKKCIRSAIRFCERETFYFNANRDVVLRTIPGKRQYNLADNKHIGTAVAIKAVYLVQEYNQNKLDLVFEPVSEEHMNSVSQGYPQQYSYFDKKLYLFPIPDQEYSLRLILSPMRFDEIDSTHTTSPWFDDAYDMIKSRAKYELYKGFIKQQDDAELALRDFSEQMDILKIETSRRRNLAAVIPTRV